MKNIYRTQWISFILSLPIFFIIQVGFNSYWLERILGINFDFILFLSFILFSLMLLFSILLLRKIKRLNPEKRSRWLYAINWIPYFFLLSFVAPKIFPYAPGETPPPIAGLIAIFLFFVYGLFLVGVVMMVFGGEDEERIE